MAFSCRNQKCRFAAIGASCGARDAPIDRRSERLSQFNASIVTMKQHIVVGFNSPCVRAHLELWCRVAGCLPKMGPEGDTVEGRLAPSRRTSFSAAERLLAHHVHPAERRLATCANLLRSDTPTQARHYRTTDTRPKPPTSRGEWHTRPTAPPSAGPKGAERENRVDSL
jgi:hypothetical protein